VRISKRLRKVVTLFRIPVEALFVNRGLPGIGVKIGLASGAAHSPSPCPLPPGERVSGTPSLDGRGKGEGDKALLTQRPIP